MSRFSTYAFDLMPHSATIDSNARLIEYFKMGSTLFESNTFSSCPDNVYNSRFPPTAKSFDDTSFTMFPPVDYPAQESLSVLLGFKQTNFYPQNNAYSSFIADHNAAKAQWNSFNVNGTTRNYSSSRNVHQHGILGRTLVPASTSLRPADALLRDFVPSTLESDLQAIWKDVELAECTSQFRNCSLSSELTSSNESSKEVNQSLESCHQSRSSKTRKIVGRGLGYYERYGTICISIPKNVPINYPPNRKVDALMPIKCNKTNQRKKPWKNINMECVFCKNIVNSDDYKSHWLKNSQNVITCPILRAYTCPLCKNRGGKEPHTIRYCPLKRQKLAEEFQRARNWPRNFSSPRASH